MTEDLIYDFGLNDGRDTTLYLAKGFRVVAVDAMPDLCEQAAHRFSAEVASGQLTIVNRAIVDRSGPVTFYTNSLSDWGTVSSEWADRNARLGSPAMSQITVEGVTAADLFAEHGHPYYVKVDIEGSDRLVLEGLRALETPPRYVSLESEKVSWHGLLLEFDLLEQLGYRRFKIVAQHKVPRQVAPNPPREGDYVDLRPTLGSSGLFGEEAPGRWLSRNEALTVYRLIFVKYRLFGDRVVGLLAGKTADKNERLAGALDLIRKALSRGAGWYDTHATL